MSSISDNTTQQGLQTGEAHNNSKSRRITVARVLLPANQAIVTFSILGITIFIYGLQVISQSISHTGYDYPALLGMKINELILTGEIWRLFTPIFLHASFLHIFFNMYALYTFGIGLERYYGHWRFLTLYILGGFAGNVGSFLFSNQPSIGASTAVFGLVAAEAIFIYRNRFFFGKKAGPMLVNTIIIVVINLMLGLSPGIDNWGHFGGLLGGLAFAWFAGPVFMLDQSATELVITDKRNTRFLTKVTIIETLFIIMFASIKFLFPES
jgi:rhomboid protease GluP